LFEHCVPTGIQHGTVTVFYGDIPVEITTFRSDGNYLDGRHPRQVTFVSSLQEDLARRDFTINALALSVDNQIVDLFGGLKDLESRLVRCIGDPKVRFQEDALRIFRAVRFSAQLGFSVEADTKAAAEQCGALCSAVSSERIRDELEKILVSDHPEVIGYLADIGALNKIAIGTPENISDLMNAPRNRITRWAALKKCWQGLDLKMLHLDKRTTQLVTEAAMLKKPSDRLDWKRMIACKGKEVSAMLADLHGEKELFREIAESGECICLSELAVNGSDFPTVKGKQLGELLKQILWYIHEHPEENTQEKIINFVNNSIDYHY